MKFTKDEYTTKEAAELLGLSEYTLRKRIRDKELNVLGKRGKTYVISKEELERYSEEKRKKGILVGGMANSLVAPMVTPLSNITSMNTSDSTLINTSKMISNLKTHSGLFGVMGTIFSSILYKILDNNIDFDKKDIKFYKEYYKGVQKDLKVAQLELERLKLDKNDTVEYKKKELDLRMKIERIEQNLQAIKMKIDSMSSQDEKKENVE